MAGENVLKVELTEGRLVISIGVDVLCHAVKYGMEQFTPQAVKITDEAAFAKDVRRELLAEEEDGTTCVHRMLDRAAWDAICGGADGVELEDDG